MIRRILVPLDGSALAEAVLPCAEQFARLTGAALTLVQVVEPLPEPLRLRAPRRSYPGPGGGELTAQAAAERAAAGYLAGVAQRLATAGLAVTTRVLAGQAAAQIIQAGQEADLIVMATHGRSGIGRWVYGSVADKVLRGASVPMLLVRARSDGGAVDCRLRRILVPLDGSELAERALPLATHLAERAGAELVLLQSIFWAEMIIGEYPYGYGPLVEQEELLEEAEAGARDYLGEVQRRLAEQGLQARVAIRYDPAADAILSAAGDEQADLIVMSTHGRGGLGRWVLGSVADRVLSGGTVPILLVRAGVTVPVPVAGAE
jgi:nucleotide-binding universal stress UspA family protein